MIKKIWNAVTDWRDNILVFRVFFAVLLKALIGSRDFRQALGRGMEKALMDFLREVDPFVRPEMMERLSRKRYQP